MRLIPILAITFTLGCASQSDMRLDESLTPSDRALAARMAELTKDRCVRQTYGQTTAMPPTGQTKISSLPIVKRLYTSESGWVKAEVTADGAWDNIYFLEPKNAIVCGEPNWQKLADSGSVNFIDVRSPSAYSRRAQPAAAGSPQAEQRPVAFRWEGEPQLVAGTVFIQQQGKSGRITARLPSSNAECTGMYEAASGAQGQWALSCTNGLTAVGTCRALGPGKGSVGSGQDSKGQRVEFTLGGSP
jgi:hypothetical protein